MAVHRTDREFSNRALDDAIRAFQIDPSWYERHWYDADPASRPSRLSVVRSPAAAVAIVAALVLCVISWQ